jgi:hypothetical protein
MKNKHFFSGIVNTSIVAFILLFNLNLFSQTLIFEDFEDATVGYILKDESNGGTVFNENITEAFSQEDYFGRIKLSDLDPADLLGFSNFNGTSFFGANDYDVIDAVGWPTTRDIVSINWNNISVPASSIIKISSLIAEGDANDGNEDWDLIGDGRAASIVRIQYSFNNSNWFDVFSIIGDNTSADVTNANPVLDSNNDNVGDVPKVIINKTFANIEGTFETGGNTNVHIRIYIENLTGTDEDIAFDDFKMEVDVPVDSTPPTVTSISVNGSPATNATSVSYDVTFSEDVTGVDTSDFTIDGSGVTGTISGISGSGANYTVSVNSVFGTGTLSIDLKSGSTNIIDAASNAICGGFTNGANHTVDTVAPTLSASNPTNNTTNVSLNQDIALTFSENISKGTGNILIKKSSDNSTFETIAISSSLVTISSTIATINPSSDFDLNTKYYLQIDATVFKDNANNNYSGISNTTTLSFTTIANQTNTFSSSGNWSDISKWSLGRLPIITDNVEIGFGVTVLLNISNAVVNNLSVNSGTLNINAGNALTLEGNLIQNGTFNMLSNATTNSSLIVKGTSTGNVTYLRYLTTNWHLVAAPINGQSINSLSSEISTNNENYAIAPYQNNVVSLERWNYFTTAAGTNNIANAGNFEKAKGYSIQKKTVAGTIAFSGTLNTNDIGESIAITDGGDNPSGNRWNLVGNPYTAAISATNAADVTNNFLKVNIDAGNLDTSQAGLYLWTGATPYEVKSIDDAAFYIAPGQAFFVHAPDNGGTSVSFTEAMQTHQTGNIFSKSTNNYPEIILQLSSESNKSLTKIRYIENKTTGLDIGSDVGTFTGFSSNFEVYTQLINNNKGVNFAIQALPNSNYENMVIPIGITSDAGKEIEFSLSTSNFDADINLFLEDRFTNTFTKLDEANSNYKITLSEKTNGIGRFYLHTTNKNVLNIDENLALENISMYKANNSTLKVVGLQSNNAKINLVTILGKQVFTTSFKSNGTADISIPKLAKGVYLVQLKTAKGNLNKKIILE